MTFNFLGSPPSEDMTVLLQKDAGRFLFLSFFNFMNYYNKELAEKECSIRQKGGRKKKTDY